MEKRNILKGAGVLLIAAIMILSTFAVTADTNKVRSIAKNQVTSNISLEKEYPLAFMGKGNDDIFYEDFDGAWPSPGFPIIDQYHPVTTWVQADYDYHTPPYSAQCWWDYGPQDEWLISAEIDLTSYTDATLFFESYVYWGSTYGDHYRCLIHPTGGTTHGEFVELWDATLLSPEGWHYYDTTYELSLTDYVGHIVRIAFQADGLYSDGLWWAWLVDTVSITAPSVAIPTLDCTGSLSWTEVEPGATVTGEFTVENVGEDGSLLDWEIDSYPDWGSNWTFDPDGGTDLPKGAPITVDVELVAPDEEDTEFEGEIVLVNSDDPDNTCIIDAALVTPVSQLVVQTAAMELASISNGCNLNNKNVGNSGKGDTFYASNLHDNRNLVYFDSDVPGIFTIISGSSATDFLAGGCFVGDIWYVCEYSASSNSNIWTIDETTGAMTLVGASGAGLNGIAYDDAADVLYGCSSTDLYTIDQATGASTLVGAMGNAGSVMIGIACDSSGNMYGEDLGDDNFYSINTATGAAAIIGSLGIDLNYAQDMAYDKDNDICYITGYKGSTNGGGALYTVDLSTGTATFIGDFPIGSMGCPSEVAGFGIPYGGEPTPDLDCDGTLSWIDVTPGDTVNGTFTVENNGDPTSLLDWEIESYPDWGTWTFDPDGGLDLTPEDGAVIVTVEVVAPDEENTEFEGEIVLVNSDDPDNTCIIDVALVTPVSQQSLIFQFLEMLAQRFPILGRILAAIF